MELIGLAVFAVLFLLLLPGARRSAEKDRKRTLARGASRIQRQMDEMYGGVHEYTEVDLATLPSMDRDFYAEITEELRREDFSFCADLEDLTVSRAQPKLRTCLRTLLGDSGLIRVGIAYWRPSGWLRLLAAFRVLPKEIRAIELVSEVGQGQFLCTSNTKGIDQMTMPPQFRAERHSPGTAAKELLKRHRERLAALIRSLPHASPVHMANYDDMLASIQRGNVVLSRHRDELGGLTEEELARIVKRPLRKNEQELLDEMARQRGKRPEEASDRQPEPDSEDDPPGAPERN